MLLPFVGMLPSLCWDATYPRNVLHFLFLGIEIPVIRSTDSGGGIGYEHALASKKNLGIRARYDELSTKGTFQPVNVTRSILSTFFQEINLELPKEIKLNEKVEVVNGMTTNQKRTFWNRL
ncbi:hypothetical protein RclHR1_04390010 [Rhizophagus clarus]|uniref:Uncharacterized protein n=1 Tax=Rhizophagus clarus TaxID=94130 RepID=A0A2Z6RUH0_9GLOM|nr:hypothetical protein RclHR1_04390010 [Rhizophagus clarus]